MFLNTFVIMLSFIALGLALPTKPLTRACQLPTNASTKPWSPIPPVEPSTLDLPIVKPGDQILLPLERIRPQHPSLENRKRNLSSYDRLHREQFRPASLQKMRSNLVDSGEQELYKNLVARALCSLHKTFGHKLSSRIKGRSS